MIKTPSQKKIPQELSGMPWGILIRHVFGHLTE